MIPDKSVKAIIFDISRFALHDGPGIRTTVFFKGCPLRCLWCQNPESFSGCPEVIYYENRCTRCGRCARACPVYVEYGHVMKSDCLGCGRCVDVCPSGVRKMAGKVFSPDELYQEIAKDRAFYNRSGGGVTLSGGEPMAQAEFIKSFGYLCKAAGLHVAIETCGYAPWNNFKKVLPFIDLYLFDIKIMDRLLHKQYTGVDNGLILENAVRLADLGKKIIVRVPLIPGYTDTVDNMEQIACFIRGKMKSMIERVELLPFNMLAGSKYGMNSIYTDGGYGPYLLDGAKTQQKEQIDRLKHVFMDSGVTVYCEAT